MTGLMRTSRDINRLLGIWVLRVRAEAAGLLSICSWRAAPEGWLIALITLSSWIISWRCTVSIHHERDVIQCLKSRCETQHWDSKYHVQCRDALFILVIWDLKSPLSTEHIHSWKMQTRWTQQKGMRDANVCISFVGKRRKAGGQGPYLSLVWIWI